MMPTSATALSPICRLSKDTEVSAAIPLDYKAAYFQTPERTLNTSPLKLVL